MTVRRFFAVLVAAVVGAFAAVVLWLFDLGELLDLAERKDRAW